MPENANSRVEYLNGLVEVCVGDLAVGSALLLDEVDLAEVHGEAGGVAVLPVGSHGSGQMLVVVHKGHEAGLDEAVEAVQVVPET